MEYKRSSKELIFCKICNQQTKYSIETFAIGHLRKYHPDCKTSKDYYDRFYKEDGEGICPVCNKETPYQTFTIGYSKHCSPACSAKNPESKKKIKDTLEKKYGDRNYVNKEALKETWKNKSDEEIQNSVELAKATKFERYGNEFYRNEKQIRLTKFKKYGDEEYTNIDKIKNSLKDFYNTKRFKYVENQIIENNLKLKLIDCKKDWYLFRCLKCEKEFEMRWQLFNLRKKNNNEICIHCNPLQKKFSSAEKEIYEFIKQNYLGVILENTKNILSGKKEFDIYLPDLKLAIEYNGLIWHSEKFNDDVFSQSYKTNEAEELGIHLIHIYEDDWIYKQSIVKSRLLNLLKNSFQKIFARNCEIKEVFSKDSKVFLEENHLQGNVNSKIRLGLYYNEELVSLMTFGSFRKSLGKDAKDRSFELYRFCNKLNTNVIGAASKLFKNFIKNNNPEEIISYADRSWSMNNNKTLYDVLGFKFHGSTKQNYYYIKEGTGSRLNRFNFRKSVLVAEGADPNKTEEEIMLERGYYRIYDSGSLKYVWNQ